jgi:hypothetical protein
VRLRLMDRAQGCVLGIAHSLPRRISRFCSPSVRFLSAAMLDPQTDIKATPPAFVSEFEKLWFDALNGFVARTGVDPVKHKLLDDARSLDSPDAIADLLEAELSKFQDFRADDSRWGELRNIYLKPIVFATLRLTDIAGELASSLVRVLPTRFYILS